MNFNDILARAFKPKSEAENGLRVTVADNSAEVTIYRHIGYGGVEAEDFRAAIAELEVEEIHVRIDSPGGDVFAARAMKTTLEQHAARVIVHVDGLAASAASFLMLAGDEIEIAKGAMVMIHNAWTITLGDYRDHAQVAGVLEKIAGTMREDYAGKAGGSAEDFTALMDDETWFTAEEAVERGLCDRVYDRDGGANARFDLSVFQNAPEPTPAPEPDYAVLTETRNARAALFAVM